MPFGSSNASTGGASRSTINRSGQTAHSFPFGAPGRRPGGRPRPAPGRRGGTGSAGTRPGRPPAPPERRPAQPQAPPSPLHTSKVPLVPFRTSSHPPASHAHPPTSLSTPANPPRYLSSRSFGALCPLFVRSKSPSKLTIMRSYRSDKAYWYALSKSRLNCWAT
jgi:hypothetical protein